MSARHIFILCVLILHSVVSEPRRSGGGSRPSYSRPSYSRPSYSRPSYSSPSHSSPSYSRPSYPSYSHPSPSPSRPSYSSPSPSRPSYSSPSPSPSRPSYSSPSPSAHSPSSFTHPSHYSPSPAATPARPSYKGFNPPAPNNIPSKPKGQINNGPVGPPVNTKPLQSSHDTHSSQTQPVGPPKTNSPLGSAPPPYGLNPPAYNPGHQTSGHPPYPPAYTPAGHPAGHPPYPPAYSPAGHVGSYPPYPPPAYSPASTYHSSYGQGTFNPPSYHASHYPHQSYHPGGTTIINNNVNTFHSSPPSYPTYSYHSHDTGSGSLGFFLGYSLGRITTPTYHTYNSHFYDGYRPRYDHYEVHHYYHNNNERIIERERVIQSNAIVGCVGDSGNICPANTTSLCTSNGALMCVTSAQSTAPCKNEKDTNCVRSQVPCVDEKTPGCEGQKNGTVSINIPCISTAKIYGNITTNANNTIIVEATQNGTLVGNGTLTNSSVVSQVPQNFCVTVLALPAVRNQTESENLYDTMEKTVNSFLEKAFGL